MKRLLEFWYNWDEDERAAAVRITGYALALAAFFFLLAEVSYLFHWREDMSLLNDPSVMDSACKAGNAAGKFGFKAGHFLVSDLFGLGSLAIPLILAALACKVIADKWPWSMVRTLVASLSGAFVVSVVLAYAGDLAGMRNAFGRGLGGGLGTYIADSLVNLTGSIMTGLILMLALCIWLFLCSPRFSRLLSGIGNGGGCAERKTTPDMRTAKQRTPSKVVKTESQSGDTVSGTSPDDGGKPLDKDASGIGIAESETAEGTFSIETDDTLDQAVTEELKPIDNRLDPPDGLPRYKAPTLDLLDSHSNARHEVSNEELNINNNKIRVTLANYKIQIKDVRAIVGPTVTLYKVYQAAGVKIADIKKLQEDIAMSLGAGGVRVVTLNDSVGIEVANSKPSLVPLKSLLNDEAYRSSNAELPVAIGYTITQKVKVFDLADAPHLLIAGATKQGKSVGLNIIVSSLLYSKHPSELKFVFIDPKMVEFSAYSELLHHYLAVLPDAVDEQSEKSSAIVKKPKDAEKVLRSLCTEMDDRYELLSKAGVNNIKLYNEKYRSRKVNPKNGHRFLPYLVVVVDEYADLTMSTGGSSDSRAVARSITNSIIRLAQKGRAAGLHVILATQRPSVDVISGIIKSNFPMRIAFRVASRTDSMTILDSPGAEKLIGKGDMLFSAGIDVERIQCGFVTGDEIEEITRFIGSQEGFAKSYNTPYYLPIPENPEDDGSGAGSVDMGKLDERFEEAARMVVMSQRGSTSDLQRKLGMGYAKAGRVMDQLQAAGIVGPQEGSKPRQVLVSDFDSLQQILDTYMK